MCECSPTFRELVGLCQKSTKILNTMPSFSKSKAKFFQVSTLLEKNSFSFDNSKGAHAKKNVAMQKKCLLEKI